jgi:acyl-CoA hydrolase
MTSINAALQVDLFDQRVAVRGNIYSGFGGSTDFIGCAPLLEVNHSWHFPLGTPIKWFHNHFP